VGEILLMSAVLYHAFNGIRVTLLDFKPEWWRYQRQSSIAVWVLFAVSFIPLGIFMFTRTLGHCSELAAEGLSCFAFPTP
jgi:succinate dehydrogenase / fumarate reductase cytochrome b subunit